MLRKSFKLNVPLQVLAKAKARGLMVLTAHPEGSRVLAERQITRARKAFGPSGLAGAQGKTAFVLGSTTFGYGSSFAIALKEAGFNRIIGLGHEAVPTFRKDVIAQSTAGYYLTNTLHDAYNGNITTYFADAFKCQTRDRVISDLKASGTKIDLLVYSLAAPRRSHLGDTWSSSLKVIGDPLEVAGLDFASGCLKPQRLDPASELEIERTRRVMGGDDLALWANSLLYAGLVQPGFKVGSLSYVGPENFTALRRIYWDGALGAAKKHIDSTTKQLDSRLNNPTSAGGLGGGSALSVVAPAVVTGASVAIPAMLKYICEYLAVAEQKGSGAIYDDPLDVGINYVKALYGDGDQWKNMLDTEGRLRLDQHELDPRVQDPIQALWADAKPGEAHPTTSRGLELFKRAYSNLYGWDVEGVDYTKPYDFNPDVASKGVINLMS